MLLRLTLPLLAAWCFSSASHAAPGHDIACADLEGPTLASCLAHQADTSIEKLVAVLRASSDAAGQVCFAVPEPAIGDCLAIAQQRADVALAEALQREHERIESDAASPAEIASWKKLSDAAQRSWRAFTDTNCGKLVDFEYMRGTGAGAAGSQCLVVGTLKRAEELRARLGR